MDSEHGILGLFMQGQPTISPFLFSTGASELFSRLERKVKEDWPLISGPQ